MRIVLEYLGVFAILWVFNYYSVIKPKLKNKKGSRPVELEYLKKIYKIKIKNIDYKRFVYVYNTINAFIIATVYIIVVYLVSNWVLKIVIGLVLLVLLLIICYGILGRYYLRKEGRD